MEISDTNARYGKRIGIILAALFYICIVIFARQSGSPIFGVIGLGGFGVITIVIYQLFRTKGKAFGVTIDMKLAIMFFVFYAILATIVYHYTPDTICPDGCDYDGDKDICVDAVTAEACQLDAVGLFSAGGSIIASISGLFVVLIAGEAWYFSGNKVMVAPIMISFVCIAFILLAIINIILSAGGNPNQIIEDSTNRMITRSDILFKGGLDFTWTLFWPDKIKLIYKGDPTDVKIEVESGTPEPIFCSTNGGDEDAVKKKLWQCTDTALNRIENKCGGDWWITSDKGCLKDTFTEIYRFIFIITTFTLVLLSVYTLKYNSNMYSLDSLKPLMFTFGMIFLYHFVYLVFNMTVSWTFKEAFLMQDFFSEVLKSGDGVWIKDRYCENVISSTYTGSAGDPTKQGKIDKDHKSIWDNDSISMKIKLILNVILSFIVIGYIGIYFGNKYIYKLVPGGLDVNARKVYFILITGLSVLIGLQVFYWFVSTILVDQCVIERISENSHKIKNQHQGFCTSKIMGEGVSVTSGGAAPIVCNTIPLRKDCINDTRCDYDNSYSFQELLRCQLDSHGGLLYHIALILIPIIAFILFNTRITAIFK